MNEYKPRFRPTSCGKIYEVHGHETLYHYGFLRPGPDGRLVAKYAVPAAHAVRMLHHMRSIDLQDTGPARDN